MCTGLRLSFLLSIVLFSAVFISCQSSDDAGMPGGNRGVLQLMLTDAPAPMKEISVKFQQIDVHATGGSWQTIMDLPVTVDLLELRNVQTMLAAASLEEGKYTGFRLLVESGTAEDEDGNSCDLKVPSDKVQIPVVFEIDSSKSTQVLVDFNAEKSIHVIQTGNGKNQCILRPVITVVSVSDPM